jgi:hypothetical protein
MSSSRSRVVALFAAVPLILSAGPMVAPALAVDSVRPAQLNATAHGGLRVGPNAGFRGDTARGIEGRTAIVALDAATGDTVESVTVQLTQDESFSVFNEFNDSDGFALYKDLDDDDLLDAADYAAGAVSQPGYGVGATPSGGVLVTVTADPATATGQDSYLLVVHPSSDIAVERTLHFTVPVNGVATSAGSRPASAVALPNIILDTLAPQAIPTENFAPVSRIPTALCPPDPEPNTCGDDAYRVHRAGVEIEDGEKIAFFNSTDLLDAALLTKKVGNTTTPVVLDIVGISADSESPSEHSIGNGTGRDATVEGSKAENNQISDDVVVRQWDEIGNVTGVTLTNTDPCTTNCPTVGFVPRGNDVTAPNVTYTVEMDNVTSSSTLSAVPVRGKVTGPDAASPPLMRTTVQGGVAQLVKVQQVDALVSDPVTYEVKHDPDTELRSGYITPTGTQATITTPADVSDAGDYPEANQLRAVGRLIDRTGNVTSSTISNVVWKDTIDPTFLKIAPLDSDHDGTLEKDEFVRVEFSEAMDTTKVTNSNVNDVLTIDTPSHPASCGGSPVPSAKPPCVNWGDGATVDWNTTADKRVLMIKLGTVCPTWNAVDCPEAARLPQQGDIVTAAASITDGVGNAIPSGSRAKTVDAPLVIAVSAATRDETVAPTEVNQFATNRDGILEAIDVTFTGDVTESSVTAASNDDRFTVSVGGDDVPATAARTGVGTVRLTFTAPADERAQWRTGALPEVTLSENAAHSTLVETLDEQAIEAFTLGALDLAPPVPLSITTQDAVVDGHLDHVLVKYTEPISHDPDKNNPCGYSVSAPYGNSAYVPPGATTAPNLSKFCPAPSSNKATPVPNGATSSDTVSLELVTQGTFDTEMTPTVTYSSTHQVPAYAVDTSTDHVAAPSCHTASPSATGPSTPNDCNIRDMSNNRLLAFTGVADDDAGPAIIERTTADTNSDGRLDEIRVKLSEVYSTPSLGTAQFTVTSPAYTVTGLTARSDREIAVRIENVAVGKGDTGVTPTLTFLGGTTDLADPPNGSPADTGATVTDKAGPAIIGACTSSPAASAGICPVESATDDKIAVLFSEAVSNVAAADFVVEQPAGTAKTQSATAPAVGGTGDYANRIVTLSFAEGTIDPALDGVVRLAGGAEFVTDAGSNHSTQTANVAITPVPTVTINLTCPVPANAGYCVQQLVNTGITGTPGVTLWRLASTARATTPPDEEFSATMPVTISLPEGPNTLYLTGKDQFGRLSEEKSGSITVYLPPTLDSVVYQNLTTPAPGTYSRTGTVVDGDSLNIKATAFGADAAQWASGGTCLAANLSLNRSGLTGKSSETAVAPLSCDKPSTGLPRRNLVWPMKAAGTTRYPVGTVLRTTTTDPGSMIVDAAGGKQARRQFISVAARRSWQIPDGLVIFVSPEAVSAIPRATNLGYRDGALLRNSSTGKYYFVERGAKRPVSTASLAYWKIPTSTAYSPTSSELAAIPTGSTLSPGSGSRHPIGSWVKFSNGSIQQIVRTGSGAVRRRELASTAALKTLVPTSHVVPANSKDLAVPKDSFLRGYRDGTLLKVSNGYAVVARGSLRRFKDDTTFNTLGYNKNNALVANGLAMPRVSGQTYHTGAVITRYLITTVVIKVKNTAGASTTKTVLPQIDGTGIYGVGTYDPVPVGWDFTRS